ncbi:MULTISPECIES: asparagine synthase (glutamine-hydrolyzing) [Helicobacter]|uniref:asparagine synthase (glutamine-hydrolyzing) n=1 Tax=Helicobacter bilis ATCC 43879 TaxID=613026 RepID=C3XDE6_9HELI|nr:MULTISPECIES: asparagine synthase (glutamine-hydrolyzing) [Helicobacter]EEO23035.1 asparagine synthase (glutamine-hydrolyzing) [Helicobacter bilis ATCC 43879]
MCGILGTIPSSNTELFNRALTTIHHRGPDSNGVFHNENISFGHTRLKIVDLSNKAAQPMHFPLNIDNVGGGVTQQIDTAKLHIKYSLVFNGEIYNFLELRDELIAKGYVFHTDSDSEVLLASYDAYGSACLNKFNGMWAFAIFNHETKDLFLSRDRFGKKPLFYAFITDENNKKKFVFASEMKAIYPFLKDLEPSSHFNDMIYNKIYSYECTEHTLIDGIKRFPHAHFTIINTDSIQNGVDSLKPQRYYHILDNMPYNPQTPKPYEDIVAEFRHLFFDSVALRMRSDVSLGTALSGGVDSSATICAMSHVSKNSTQHLRQSNDWQHACIACFKDTPFDESKYAKAVCDHIHIQGEFLEINPVAHWDKIEHYFYLFEDLYTTSPVPMIATYQAIKQKGVTVTLDGHGADELFSGYGHVLQSLWDARFNIKQIKNILHTLNDSSEAPKPTLKLYKDGAKFLLSRFNKKIRNKLYTPHDSHPNFNKLDYFSKWLYELFTQDVLQTLLRNYDRYSMINGIEVRMPFLDHRLVEFVFSLPYTYKIRNGYTKALIRDALHDIMPESVIWRKSKMGFVSPIVQWMQRDRKENGLKEWFLDIAHSKDFLECNLVRNPKDLQTLIIKICNKEENNYRVGEQVWCELNPYLWQKSLIFAKI